MSINVVVADGHEVVRIGLATLFKGSGIEIVGEATTARLAVIQTVKHKPDIVLLEIRLGKADGFTVLKEIRKKAPKTAVVILSTYDNPTYIARSMALGATDYVLKRCTRKQLIAAIRKVARGKFPTAEGHMQHIAAAMNMRDTNMDHLKVPFTCREVQVLRHLGLGLSNREISLSLEISTDTTKEHVQNILRKLDANDRTQAAVWAVRHKLV